MILLYEPSGRFSPLALFFGLGLGGLLSAGLGLLYQDGQNRGLYLFLAMALPLLMGAGIGLIAGKFAQLGKSRNSSINGAVAVLCGLIALGAGYFSAFTATREAAAKAYAAAGRDRSVVLERWTFFNYLEYRYHFGWEVGVGFGTNDIEVNGGVVYLAWLAEAAMVTLPAFFIARRFARPSFCESCNCWTKTEHLHRFAGVSAAPLHAVRGGADLGALLEPRGSTGAGVDADYFVHRCAHCRETIFLSVGIAGRGIGFRPTHDWIVRHAAIDDDDLERLESYIDAEDDGVRLALAKVSKPLRKPR